MVFSLTAIEIAGLFLGLITFGVALRYFIIYMRSLRQALKAKLDSPIEVRYEVEKERGDKKKESKAKKNPLEDIPVAPRPSQVWSDNEGRAEHKLGQLRDVIHQQQELLNSMLEKAGDLKNEELQEENELLQLKLEKMEANLEEAELDNQKLRQQVTAARNMAERVEEIHREFELMQQKMMELEKQASQSQKLALELEDMRDGYESLRKDLQRKQARLEETVAENQRLHYELGEVEDKLAESNLQRQQLNKKVQFLQELNNDMQNMSEANKKMQTEMRRIGELESMLNMIAEERDQLLRKQFGR